ncbi:MAG: PIG-L deacetylase family protein [Candidatus Woesearchaeota archaeon]
MGNKSVYIICAHSDDQVLGVGGTAAKYAREGIDVITIIMSYGEMSHFWMQGKFTTKMRVKESQKANEVLNGKKVMFFGLKEGKFKEDIRKKNLLKNLRKMINEDKPTKIFTHSINDPHPDHRETLEIVADAVSGSRHKPDIYTFLIWNPIPIKKRNRPKLVVDTSKTTKLKIRSAFCFKSQKLSILQLLPVIIATNFINGFKYNMRFAELFFRYDIDDHKKSKRKKRRKR